MARAGIPSATNGMRSSPHPQLDGERDSVDRQLAVLGSRVAIADGLPVDDVPPGLEILGAAVLILQVIGVLPTSLPMSTRPPSMSGVSWLGFGDEGELAGSYRR